MSTETKVLDHASRAHAVYSPSTFDRAVNCPWSLFDSKSFPDSGGTAASDEGTLGHEVAETLLEDKLEGRRYRILDPEKYDADMRKCGRHYAEFIYSVIEPYLSGPHYWCIEKKLEIDVKRDIWGTADFVFIYKDSKNIKHVIIFDYKYGLVPVEVKNNWQIVGYLWGVQEAFKGSSGVESFGTAEAYIYQPRVHGREVETYTPEPWRISFQELRDSFIPKVDSSITLNEAWESQGFVPEEEQTLYTKTGNHCKYCKKKGVCNAYKEQTSGPVLRLFKKVSNELKLQGGKAKMSKELIEQEYKSGTIAIEDLVFIALNRSKIETFLEEAAKIPLEMIKNGFSVPGCKVVEANPPRVLISDEERLVTELKKLGIKEPIEVTRKVIGLTKIESIIGKNKIDHLIVPPTSKSYKLVAESHKADAVNFEKKSSAMFSSIVNRIKQENGE